MADSMADSMAESMAAKPRNVTRNAIIRCTYNDHAPHHQSRNRSMSYEYIVATASPEQYETYWMQ